MSFLQIKIKIGSQYIDQLSDAFFESGAISVSIEDEHEGTDLEQAIFNEPTMEIEKLWEHSLLTVLFNADTDVETITRQIKNTTGIEYQYILEHVDDKDWVRLTQSQFAPIKVTEKLYIVPSWHTLPTPEATGIILDPGLAFGTGSHPTTFMCLEWLANTVTPDLEVLDYGCGSGILAITAKKLGARKVVGVDIDKQAIEASRYNAEINQVDVAFKEPAQFKAATFDVVVANILSNPLRLLAGVLAAYVNPGGKIVLSGILETQIDEMSQIYAKWFNMQTVKIMDSWACLLGVRQ